MAIFVDEDSDTRLARRGALQQLRRILAFFSHKMARATADRDMRERGRDMQSILRQYLTFVKPSFDEYIFPTKKYADIIFPRGKENQGMAVRSLHAVFRNRLLSLSVSAVAINLIVQHIQDVLREGKEGAPAKRQGGPMDYQKISQ